MENYGLEGPSLMNRGNWEKRATGSVTCHRGSNDEGENQEVSERAPLGAACDVGPNAPGTGGGREKY